MTKVVELLAEAFSKELIHIIFGGLLVLLGVPCEEAFTETQFA